MSKIPPKGQGPFQRGERLTAAKLNEYVAPRPARIYGQGHAEGDTVFVDQLETMYIRLIEKDISNVPIKYGWKRVCREPNGTWSNLTHTGNLTSDYACEINDANLTVGTSTVYRAERSLTTGEWLFISPCCNNTTVPEESGSPITVSMSLLGGFYESPAGDITTVDLKNRADGSNTAFSPLTPSYARIANVTLQYTDHTNATTVLGVWTEANASFSSFTFDPPYEPSVGQPLTLTMTANTSCGTLMGYRPPYPYDICGSTITGELLDSTGSTEPYAYGAVNTTFTANSVIRTTAGGTVPIVLTPNVTAHVPLEVPSISLPTEYTFQQSWTGPAGSILDFFNTAVDAVFFPGGNGGSAFTGTETSIPVRRYSSMDLGIGWTFDEDWTTPPVWPNATITYSHGILSEGGQMTGLRYVPSTDSASSSALRTHYGTPCTTYTAFSATPNADDTVTVGSDVYTMTGGTITPGSLCSGEAAMVLDGGMDGVVPTDIVDADGATDIYDGGSA